ncbi:hypothetical protein ALQ04_02968 [Pseudomonas cichorii]|uniref:Lipoprotein n=1 Tax=Pseudomonas cichorii TaxID=36746 RepID=A0A3M4LQ63_PSECI|nr:hypothetical protein [Pseudomonas cichorii]RMQ43629.1 hypothetical protein ALQ04_02968 [Pseudomonas cichorii]
MKTLNIIVACLLLSGCIAGDCIRNCYIMGKKDPDLLYKCEMDPNRYDCPVQR